MGRSMISFDLLSEARREFKEICDREGETMAHKLRKWIYLYIQEHKKGNPQTLLGSKQEKSLLEQVLEEKQPPEFPMTRIRREVIVELAKFLNEYSNMNRSDAIQLFALKHGFRVDTIRKYVCLLDSQARSR